MNYEWKKKDGRIFSSAIEYHGKILCAIFSFWENSATEKDVYN